MNLHVEHRLAFEYDAYISESFLELRVQPKVTATQLLNSFFLAVGPPTKVYRYVDWNENLVHHFNVTRYHNQIEVISRSVVSTNPAAPALAAVIDPMPLDDLPYSLDDFLQLGGPVQGTSALRKFHRALSLPRGARLGEAVKAVSDQMRGRFSYQRDVTRYDSTTEDFLKLGAGVCQDFAHLMLGVLRLHGVPCRYVSGYLHLEGKRAEPSQSHAWIEFHSPRHGWVPFDPTHGREIDERYIIVGHGRHYDDVPPNRGIYRGNAAESLKAEVRTKTTTQRTPPMPQDAVLPIDLPVFNEAPGRKRDFEIPGADLVSQQQQQQQQQ